jgi:O-antigen ligase
MSSPTTPDAEALVVRATSVGVRIWRSPHLLALSYLVLTQGTTFLMIAAGLCGLSELAASIGLVHGAALATFYAFSSNARNLILTTRVRIPLTSLLASRIALVAPLSALALLLSVAVTGVEIALAAMIVVRRAAEWIVELELSERELAGDVAVARLGIVSQAGLLVATVLVMATAPLYVFWVMLAWAISPLMLLTRGFLRLWPEGAKVLVRGGGSLLLPHFGSTAVNGISIYVFRAMLVLVAGKALAGDLFTAFAIGSFAGTLFANVFGPSILLAEERAQRTRFPVVISSLLLLYVCVGIALSAATWVLPTLFGFTGKSIVFWRAAAWSLLGGAVMLLAQRVRLNLLAKGRDVEVFGSDVAMNVCLITAIPVLYAMNVHRALETLYFLNAVLLLLLYLSAERGFAERLAPDSSGRLAGVLTFCVFLPLFLQLSGHVYDSPQPVVDSGGVLGTVPLPVSLIACFAGVALLARFSATTPALWTILGLLATMLLSTVVLAEGPGSAERAKMILMLQVLLPAAGLLLAAMVTFGVVLERVILATVALIVPAQLLISWSQHSLPLTHSLYLFSVYQHQQYVPVVLASAFILVLPGTWKTAGTIGRFGMAALSFLLALYVTAAYSTVAMLVTMLGVLGFGVLQLVRRRSVGALFAAAISVAGLAGYNYLLSETVTWQLKFGAASEPIPAPVGWYLRDAVRPGLFDWRISTQGGMGTELMHVNPPLTGSAALLQVEGDLIRGGLEFVVMDRRGVPVRRSRVDRPGRFGFELGVPNDVAWVVVCQGLTPCIPRVDGPNGYWSRPGAGNTAFWVPSQPGSDPTVSSATEAKLHLAFRNPASTARSTSQPVFPAPQQQSVSEAQIRMKNMAERIGDWRLFGGGAVESIRAFLFGHDKPIPREVRTSAHNFYLDLVYNFGVIALLPLLALMVYTGALLWKERAAVYEDDSLFMHAAVIAFLLAIECNLKVTLRQPYPGIAIYLLWGLLLWRLRQLDSRSL